MEEKQFEINKYDLYYYVDSENKVTLFIMNSDKTKVRTIDEFGKKTGGRDVKKFNYGEVNDLELKIKDDYRNRIRAINDKMPLFGRRKTMKLEEIEDLKRERDREVEKLWKDNCRDFPVSRYGDIPNNGYYVSYGKDWYHIEEVSRVYTYASEKYSFSSLKELKDLEQELQEKCLANVKEEKLKEQTAEYLKF